MATAEEDEAMEVIKARDRRRKKCEDKVLRECRKCGEMDHWRHMESRRLPYEEWPTEAIERSGTIAEASDVRAGTQKTQWDHLCVECVAKRDDLSLPMAARHICGKKSSSRLKRCAEFREAMKNPEESIAMVEGHRAESSDTSRGRRAEVGMTDPTKVAPEEDMDICDIRRGLRRSAWRR